MFEVPERWRREGPETVRIDWDLQRQRPMDFDYVGLFALFPEVPALATVFNSDSDFRHELRKAMRSDLFTPKPKLTAELNCELKELFTDLTKPHVKAPLTEIAEDAASRSSSSGSSVSDAGTCSSASSLRRTRAMPELTEVFASHGVDLPGEVFVAKLLSLGNLSQYGHFSDLVGKPHEGHRWHQDHGDDRYTVMLGFPPENDFEGEGVFSHIIRLSHPLRHPRMVKGWTAGTPLVVNFPGPNACIFRPVYKAGQEVMVYKDSACLHSTPDIVHREALWRFM